MTGLTSADFRSSKTERKKISHFAAYASATASQQAAAAPVAAPPPRKFIFYLDQMALSHPTMKKFKAQLDRLFRETMRHAWAA